MHPNSQDDGKNHVLRSAGVNRRDFLGKGVHAAAGVFGLGAIGAIAGCGGDDGGSAGAGGDDDVQQAYDGFVKKEIPDLSIDVVRGAKEEGTLNAYLLVPEYNKELVEAFQEKFPFISVQPTYINGGPLVAKFLAEVRSGNGIADLAQFSSLADAMSAMKDKYVKPYTLTSEPKLNMAAGVKGSIYPVTGELLTIAYNPENVKDSSVTTLKKWDGILDPTWTEATFAVGEVLAGGTTQLLNYYFYKKFGTKLWERVAGAGHGIYPGGNPELQTVISGEHDLAIGVPQSLAVSQLQQSAPVHWTNPQEWLASPYAQFISAKAQHVNAAKLFQEFSVTPTAQTIFAKSGGISYRKGFQYTGGFTKESWYEPVDPSEYWPYSVQDLGKQMPDIAKQWRAIVR